MRVIDYHGRHSRAVSKSGCWLSLALILATLIFLPGCYRGYDILGRPMIIDASGRRGSQESVAARRPDDPRSNPAAPNSAYRPDRRPGDPASHGRESQFSGPTNANPMVASRQSSPSYPMRDPQQDYNRSGYTPGYPVQSGQPDQPMRDQNPSGRELATRQGQGTTGSMEPRSYPEHYGSGRGVSMSQGYSPVQPNSAPAVGRQNIPSYDPRQRASEGNYGSTIPDRQSMAAQRADRAPAPMSSPGPAISYGHSSTGMPEASLDSITEIQPSASTKSQPTRSYPNTMVPPNVAITTRVEPGSANSGFSSNSTVVSPSFPVPNPSFGSHEGFIEPAVSVRAAGYTPDRNSLINAISELEKYQGSGNSDLHTSLALHYLYLTQQQPERANQFLPKDEGHANRTLELLDHVRDQVSQRADFVISRMKICDKVVSFGNYHEINLAKLESGDPQNVYVYCELENFQSKQDIEGRYLSDIFITITLYDNRYTAKCQKAVPVDDTPSYSRRQDFFLIGDLAIPKLSPGKYLLRVEVEDKIANKRAKPQEIVFEVKASAAGVR